MHNQNVIAVDKLVPVYVIARHVIVVSEAI